MIRMILSGVLAVVAVGVLTTPSQAQPGPAVERTESGYILRAPTPHGIATQRFPSAARMLADFARLGHQPQLGQVIFNRAPFPTALVDSLVLGLEQLALTGAHENIRSAAVSTLVFMGRDLPDGTERVIRIFERSNDQRVRGNVLVLLPMTSQKSRALGFLRRVAVRSGGPQDEPAKAITSLAHLGSDGQAVLRELHASGAVRSQEARSRLTALARNGYREPTGRP